MKRVVLLILTLACLAGNPAAGRADGVDLKVKGEWDFAFGWASNTGFSKSRHGDAAPRSEDPNYAVQRMRTQIDFIMSEYLSGVVMFEIGSITWGRAEGGVGTNSGGAINADGVNLSTKRAYLDWIIPGTEIQMRMGIQGVALPSTPMGTPVLDSDVAGISIAAPLTDWLSANFLWMRPYDQYWADDTPRMDETDIFGIFLPMQFEDLGLKVTPWFLYGLAGAGSGIYDYLFRGEQDNTVGRDYEDSASLPHSSDAGNARSSVFWAGALLEFDLLDPLVLNVEAIYGNLRRTDVSGLGGDELNIYEGGGTPWRVGTSGWYIGATLDYTLELCEGLSMTPGLFGWWSSGDNDSAWRTGKLGRLPTLSVYNAGFAPTTFGTAGTYSIGRDSVISGTGIGSWGLGVKLADITNPFVEDLTHTLRFAWYQGTNSSSGVRENGGSVFGFADNAFYLTDKDHVFEVNFDHSYQIYENLTAIVELGWLRLAADRDTWQDAGGPGRKGVDDAWKAQLTFNFSF